MNILNIRTPSGRLYHVLENGDITVAGVPVSGQWEFIGLQHVCRNEAIFFKELTKEFLENFESCWKNGRPQWTVKDKDHGTIRIWGNAKYHGVVAIWRD